MFPGNAHSSSIRIRGTSKLQVRRVTQGPHVVDVFCQIASTCQLRSFKMQSSIVV